MDPWDQPTNQPTSLRQLHYVIHGPTVRFSSVSRQTLLLLSSLAEGSMTKNIEEVDSTLSRMELRQSHVIIQGFINSNMVNIKVAGVIVAGVTVRLSLGLVIRI
jgi:hypothetical protein